MSIRPALRTVSLSLVLVSLCVPNLRAQEGGEDPATLTIERIYDSGDFSAPGAGGRWLEDGSGYTTLERSQGPAGGRDIVRHDPATGAQTVLVPAADLVPPGGTAPLNVEDYEFSQNRALLLIYTNTRRVWRRNTRGDYWVLDRSSRELHRLGGDAPPSSLQFAKLSPRGDRAAYVRENDIWVEDLRDREVVRLTTSRSETTINGTFDWVYEEELGLRDGFRWSPDGGAIAFWQLDSEGVREFPLLNYTDSLYPVVTRIRYPKVGERNPSSRLGILDVDGGPGEGDLFGVRWIDLPGDPREHYIARMEWAGLDEIVFQRLNRLQNTNRVWFADRRTSEARTVFSDEDDAWVEVVDTLEWLRDGRSFLWISERDGWRHAYLVERDGSATRRLTPESHDVIEVARVDEKEGWLYYVASPADPTARYLFRARLEDGHTERVTPPGPAGTHRYRISPDARLAFHTYSTFDEPPRTELVRLPSHESVRVLEENAELRAKLGELERRGVEFFRADIGAGVELDGWCMKPPDFDPGRRYPLLVYVYGEPAGTTVRNGWGGSTYLWHLMLTQKGYLVMSFDNRGTPAPRGRAWRKLVYRQVGILAPEDQAAALRSVLETRPYIDPERVAIWGWSGGGSMSLNAIFKFPDLYGTAMAVAPVPNQRYYDTIYQERYMGLPHDNVDGFRRGSPLNYAHQLEGNLLLVHGTGDDNCHYQGTEALVDELIRHNKRFTMMAYPNRTHAIREGVNTTLHLRALLTDYLLQHVAPGPQPSGPLSTGTAER